MVHVKAFLCLTAGEDCIFCSNDVQWNVHSSSLGLPVTNCTRKKNLMIQTLPTFVPTPFSWGAMFLAEFADGSGTEIIARIPSVQRDEAPAEAKAFIGLDSGVRYTASTLGETFIAVGWFSVVGSSQASSVHEPYESFNMGEARHAVTEHQKAMAGTAANSAERRAVSQKLQTAIQQLMEATDDMRELRPPLHPNPSNGGLDVFIASSHRDHFSRVMTHG